MQGAECIMQGTVRGMQDVVCGMQGNLHTVCGMQVQYVACKIQYVVQYVACRVCAVCGMHGTVCNTENTQYAIYTPDQPGLNVIEKAPIPAMCSAIFASIAPCQNTCEAKSIRIGMQSKPSTGSPPVTKG